MGSFYPLFISTLIRGRIPFLDTLLEPLNLFLVNPQSPLNPTGRPLNNKLTVGKVGLAQSTGRIFEKGNQYNGRNQRCDYGHKNTHAKQVLANDALR